MANKGHQVVVPRIQYSKYEYKVVRKLIDQNIAKEPLHLVREELADYKDLLLRFIRENLGGVENYLRFVTTKDHFRAKLLDSLSQISSTDTAIQTEKESILQEVTRLDQMVPPVDEYEYIVKLQRKGYTAMRRPPNPLFLVLPSILDQWDEADVATHSFRLYFLCNWAEVSNLSHKPSIRRGEAHLPCHPGYDINRPHEFLQQHGYHALAVLLMVKYVFVLTNPIGPILGSFMNRHPEVTPYHDLTEDNIGPLIDKAIAYIQAFLRRNRRTLTDGRSWDVKPFLHLDDFDNGSGDMFMRQIDNFIWYIWGCKSCVSVLGWNTTQQHYIQSFGGTFDPHNDTIRVSLSSTSAADRLVQFRRREDGTKNSEAFVHISWNASRNELRQVCEQLVDAGFQLLHVHGISSSVASQGPIEFNCSPFSRIILSDYSRPGEIYESITLSKTAMKDEFLMHEQSYRLLELPPRSDPQKNHFGLLFQSQVEVPDICWSTLVIDVFSELVHREKIIGTAEFESLQVKLERNTVWDLSGIDIFDPTSNCWQGRLRVKNGLLYGLVEAVVPNDKFDRAILEGGSLRRVVLQSDTTCDMVQVVSLMECSGSLERIEFLTKESTILSRIATIRNNYGHNTCPLELIFSNQQKTTLARLTIGHSVDSQVVDTGPYEPITPPIDVLEWNLDRVHEPMQDSCAQVLDDASRQHPSILVNFTLDMTALTAQGFLHIGKVLQQSALECLHVKCVSFRPFQEERIAKVLQAIRWPTIKSLILTGNNIDDWLQLWVRHAGLHDSVGVWADSSASGPSLVSLRIRGHEKNKSNLSHASALAIHYLVYSCRLVELRVENILLENKEEWQMVLDGIHYSSLRSVSLQGSNISDSQRRKAVTKKSLLHIKDRVGGWIRKKL
ncbi:hypothetical protein MVEG_08307 [Podila verticillata NRRL 6337]|nr:hypothetical protein MVEG_08307 [Podila verticillata NRRL 6337]